MNAYFQLATIVFLTVLIFIKYKDEDELRESIEEYVADVCTQEVFEDYDMVEIEEVGDEIFNFVIENKKIFYNTNI